MNINKLRRIISESLMELEENYPAGSQNDPRAPWNQENVSDSTIQSIEPHPQFQGDYIVHFDNYEPYHLSSGDLEQLGYWSEELDGPTINLEETEYLPENLVDFLINQAVSER